MEVSIVECIDYVIVLVLLLQPCSCQNKSKVVTTVHEHTYMYTHTKSVKIMYIYTIPMSRQSNGVSRDYQDKISICVGRGRVSGRDRRPLLMRQEVEILKQ